MKLTTDQKIALREMLKTITSVGVSEVVFEKADGTIRTMKVTRDYTRTGAETRPVTESARAESIEMLPVFDTESQSWCGFTFERLISVNGVKIDHLIKLVS